MAFSAKSLGVCERLITFAAKTYAYDHQQEDTDSKKKADTRA